tara:strand:- start:4036 stop:5295 length:1260 start_codon:yes stop_codon:yes gene_type:complete
VAYKPSRKFVTEDAIAIDYELRKIAQKMPTGGSGTITGVTAGNAISGGGTTGTVTVNFAPSELSSVTVASDDKVIIADTSDSDNPKTVTASTIAGLVTNISGNAATATALETARTIGGVSFNGTANIDLAGVNTAGNQNTSGNAATTTALATARAINGVDFDGTAAITVTADANTLSGTTLKSTVVNSSLTSVGTLTHDLTIGDTLILTGDDVSHISNSTNSGREILQLRAKTANSNGAGINLYGDGDSSNAGKTIFFNNNGTSLVINADKQVTKPSVCAFRVANNTGGAGYIHNGSSTGAGAIIFGNDSGTGLYDNGNNYNTSNGTFTAPVTGYYLFTMSFFKYTTYDNDTNTYWGFNTSNGQMVINHGIKGQDGGTSVSGVFYLDANDTCQGYVFSALDLYSWRTEKYNSFQGILLG